MIKVVINGCYGGYGLSWEAVQELVRLKGEERYFYVDAGGGFRDRRYKRIVGDPKGDPFVLDVSVDLGPEVSNDELFAELRKETYRSYFRYPYRSDADLVAVVEKLGKKADGYCAKLKVVEIPDDVDWTIEEYDGMEQIAEVHRTWG